MTRRSILSVPDSPTIGLNDKLEYLSRPESYTDESHTVDVIETHFAYVFLTRTHAYKLKKPMRTRDFDFTTLDNRRHNCEIEVELNRRLAGPTYLGTAPLRASRGGLHLDADGPPVDWLVKMKRLPAERMLDRVAAEHREQDEDLGRLMTKLCAFYHDAPRAPWDARQYVSLLVEQIERTADELAAARFRLDAGLLRDTVGNTIALIGRHAALLESRISAGRVVDAHGDLRPEHICLVTDPQIIDCLEFSAKLRLLDAAEEIGFLDLECERLGRPDLGRTLLALYMNEYGDNIDSDLYRVYRCRRALVRALLSARHLEDDVDAEATQHWVALANWYLDAAAASIERCAS